MEVRCPQCHSPLDLGDDSLLSEFVCAGCGDTFTLAAGEEAVALESGPPKTLGHFQLIERIGAGSFGTVWKAHDHELERTVAIKIPRRGGLDPEGLHRLLREAQASAQLRHPNIVTVYEVGREDATAYVVSDFVPGVTLQERLKESPFTPREAAEMCAQIADGLEHAHAGGVVHRDLKPGNILLDSAGVPHIVDFGLARREVGEVTMTLEGRIFGTPAYAPPEQVRGEATHADRRSDLYSLGVILFEMLTGERPFRGNVQMILHQVISEDAPNPRSFNGNVPRDLETICLKCLEKSPNKRYQSGAALRDDLRRYLKGLPIEARPITAIDRGKKWIRRHPAVSLLTATILLMITIGASAVLWQWRATVGVQKRYAHTLVESVLNAEPQVVASVISDLDDFRRWVDPALKARLSDPGLSKKHRYRAHLALLPAEPEKADYVFQQLLDAEGDSELSTREILYGAGIVREYRDRVEDALWGLLEDPGQARARRIRAALILARLYGDSSSQAFRKRLKEQDDFVVDGLLEMAVDAPAEFQVLLETMRPVGKTLLAAFEDRAVNPRTPEGRRLFATSFFGEYVGTDLDRLVAFLLQVEGEQYARLLPYAKNASSSVRHRLLPFLERAPGVPAEDDRDHSKSERHAAALTTLLHLGHPAEDVWPLLQASDDMRLRTSLIQAFVKLRLPEPILVESLLRKLRPPGTDAAILQAFLLSLGEYPSLEPHTQKTLVPLLSEAFKQHPDCGVHSAIGWLLKRWGHANEVETMTVELSQSRQPPGYGWYVNGEAITMAVIDEPPPFLMGSPETEPVRDPEERQHWRKIDRRFAVSTTEITVNQFMRYVNSDPESDYVHRAEYGPADGPAIAVTWLEAVKYCRWLSEREKISEDEMCFPRLSEISKDMKLSAECVYRTGYRLATDGEWEYACRAGTVTSRFYGDSQRLVGNYGWYLENSNDRTNSVGSLRPNGFGLFDVYGNAWEWCLDYYGNLPLNPFENPFLDLPRTEQSRGCVLRGGSITNRATALRSAERDLLFPLHDHNHNVGFRIVRTVPSGQSSGDPR